MTNNASADPFALLNLPNRPLNDESIQLPDHYLNTPFRGRGSFQNAAINHDNTPENTPTTNEGAPLGRVLFYDNKLSAKSNIACASCHKQELGFADDVQKRIWQPNHHIRPHRQNPSACRFITWLSKKGRRQYCLRPFFDL